MLDIDSRQRMSVCRTTTWGPATRVFLKASWGYSFRSGLKGTKEAKHFSWCPRILRHASACPFQGKIPHVAFWLVFLQSHKPGHPQRVPSKRPAHTTCPDLAIYWLGSREPGEAPKLSLGRPGSQLRHKPRPKSPLVRQPKWQWLRLAGRCAFFGDKTPCSESNQKAMTKIF